MNRLSKLIKGSIVVTFGTVVGGVLSYLFSALMGRLLGPAVFSDIGGIGALLAILTSTGAGLTTVTMYYSSRLYAQDNYLSIRKLHRRFTSILLVGSVLLVALLAFNASFIAQFFSIRNTDALMVGLISVIFSFLIVVNRGILQGIQNFLALSWSSVIELALKLSIALLAVRLGYGLLGVVGAITISLAISYPVSFLFLRDVLRSKKRGTGGTEKITKKGVFIYSIPALISTTLLLFATNVDILIVKRFFDPITSGQYIAVSSIAKIILYFVGPIASVMFPMITEHQVKGEKHYQTLVYSLIFTIGLCLIAQFIFYFFPSLVINLLYGQKFVAQAHLLSATAWFTVLLSLVNLMAQYYLSIKKFFYIIFFLIGIIVIVLYGYFIHPRSIIDVVHMLQLVMGFLLATMLGYYVYLKRGQLKDLVLTNGGKS